MNYLVEEIHTIVVMGLAVRGMRCVNDFRRYSRIVGNVYLRMIPFALST